jgi:hypothetical protein
VRLVGRGGLAEDGSGGGSGSWYGLLAVKGHG